MLANDVEDLIAERPICKGTQDQYRRAVRCYSAFLDKPAARDHLQEPPVNRWLLSLDGRKAPETIRGRKAGITAVWNWLAGRGLIEHYNQNRLRRIKLPEHVPLAWSVENVRSLLAGAAVVQGRLKSGISAAQMLTAWVWIGYEGGIRPSDVMELRCDMMASVVHLVQHKTGKLHSFGLSEHAIRAIEPLLVPGQDKLFGLNRSAARRWELKLYEAAEQFGFSRRKGQGIGTLRKTHGTEVCRRSGIDAAAKSLGHVSGTLVAKRSYVQPDAIAVPPPPPSLYNAGQGFSSVGANAPDS